MSVAKKKTDDKNLKILRELLSLQANKHCFDCNQRGPTYINMTVGSFVCTGCSGLLRGLNPPHRVKSVSMASFNQDEMEFLKTRGNELCGHIWLGLHDHNSFPEIDSRNDNSIKEFMISKYEKKRYYVAPSNELLQSAIEANKKAFERIEKGQSQRGQRSVLGLSSSFQPTSAINISRRPVPTGVSSNPVLKKNESNELTLTKEVTQANVVPATNSLISVFDTSNDLFSTNQTVTTLSSSDAFFNMNVHPIQAMPPSNPKTVQPNVTAISSTSSSDKYAALAELDGLFGGMNKVASPVTTSASTVSSFDAGSISWPSNSASSNPTFVDWSQTGISAGNMNVGSNALFDTTSSNAILSHDRNSNNIGMFSANTSANVMQSNPFNPFGNLTDLSQPAWNDNLWNNQPVNPFQSSNENNLANNNASHNPFL